MRRRRPRPGPPARGESVDVSLSRPFVRARLRRASDRVGTEGDEVRCDGRTHAHGPLVDPSHSGHQITSRQSLQVPRVHFDGIIAAVMSTRAMEGGRDGGCACGAVRYRFTSEPLVVHCCHCLNCQRQTGNAFVINLLLETDWVEVLQASRGGTGERREPPLQPAETEEISEFLVHDRPFGRPRATTSQTLTILRTLFPSAAQSAMMSA